MSTVEIPGYGQCIVVGNRIYTTCAACGSLVWVNKRFLGSTHICVDNPD